METNDIDTRQRAVEVAEAHVLFREVNERIESVSVELGAAEFQDYVCECADAACTERVRLSPAEYEDVRASSIRFVVAPGHETEGVERLVESGGDYDVVELTAADAIGVARARDPRS